jgi:Ca2+-binding RTX toxin-like protein
MASINNLNEVAQNALQKAVIIDSLKEGIQEFTVDDLKVFTSSVRDINLNIGNANHALLTGDQDLDIVGNDNDNFIVGNDGSNWIDAGNGNDQISTGAGDDFIKLGAGDDVIEIDGPGDKTVNGGEGNDLFVIKPGLGENSHVTFTNLNVGDKLRVYADANQDGKITWDDVESVGPDADGNTTFVLKDGSSFTLEGVGNKDDITYTIGEDGEGNLYVELS